MKDVLISSMMSMLNNSFASESLTTECILSSNEISYSLKLLIDIKAANYSFIDEVIAQIVCDQLQIKSLTLIKAKSIQEFDDHYVKKLITHVIYSNLTVQDQMIDTAFMLITSIKSISNDSWKNMNEQNQSSNWYANQFSSIFEFHSQFKINCSTHKQ